MARIASYALLGIFVLVASIMIVIGISLMIQKERLSGSTTATITASNCTTVGNQNTCKATIEYAVNGQDYTNYYTRTVLLENKKHQRDLQQGKQFPIRYNIENPNEIQHNPYSKFWRGLALTVSGGFLLLLSIVIVVWYALSSRK